MLTIYLRRSNCDSHTVRKLGEKIVIFAEPGSLSDGLVPTAIRDIVEHDGLTLHSLVDVREEPEPTSYICDFRKRVRVKKLAHGFLRQLSGLPSDNYPNCRAWADAPHTPDTHIIEAPDPNDETFVRYIRGINPDVILLLGCSHILQDPYFEISGLNIINYHWSYLPEYPGRYVTMWAPYNHEEEHGVTFHTISREVDQGMAIVQQRVPIRAGGPTLAHDCLATGRELLPEVLDRIASGNLRATTQIGKGDMNYAYEFENKDFGFDVSESPEEIESRIRAREYVKAEIDNNTVVITGFQTSSRRTSANDGDILSVSTDGLLVAMNGEVGRITSLYYLPAWLVAPVLGVGEGDTIVG